MKAPVLGGVMVDVYEKEAALGAQSASTWVASHVEVTPLHTYHTCIMNVAADPNCAAVVDQGSDASSSSITIAVGLVPELCIGLHPSDANPLALVLCKFRCLLPSACAGLTALHCSLLARR